MPEPDPEEGTLELAAGAEDEVEADPELEVAALL